MTIGDVPAISAAELAARMAVHRASWRDVWGLLVDSPSSAEIAGEVAEELRFVADIDATPIAVEADLEPTLTALRRSSGVVIVLYGFGPLDPEAWRRLDALREGFRETAGLVLLLRPADLETLQEHAPNFSSWLGGRVWRLSDEAHDLSREEVQTRLDALRAAYDLTDADVVTLAGSKKLPPEPEFAEWLILLGQGDLLR